MESITNLDVLPESFLLIIVPLLFSDGSGFLHVFLLLWRNSIRGDNNKYISEKSVV